MAAAFLPIWLLTAVGYAAARFRLIGPDPGAAEALLGRFVFRIAMPAALFGMLAKTDLHALANTSILAFAASAVLTFAVGLAVSRRVFRRPPAEQAMAGMAGGYVNSANLGIPVAIQVLGNGSFVTTVILLQTVVITPLILTVVDAGKRAAGSLKAVGDAATRGPGQTPPLWRRRLRDAATLPLRNPIIIASALGAITSAAHWRLQPDLARSITLLGGAAVPTALIALGMSLHGRGGPAQAAERRPGTGAETAVAIGLKTLAQPALAFLAGRFLLRLGPHDLLAVVLCAGLPTAQNVFIYAREYELPTALPRDAVIFSTLVSMATLWGVVALLGT